MLKNNQQYVVLATSTDLGKTFFVTEICKKLKKKNIDIEAIKPIASGFASDDLESDTAKILLSLNKKINQENIDKTTPFRLKAPFSPLKAANLEGVKINFDEVVKFCQIQIEQAKSNDKMLLIEGAGGVMTPINIDKTFLDLADKLKIKVLLIGGVYLGAISNILCAIEALKSRNIEIEAIIINGFVEKNQNLTCSDIIGEVENFAQIKTISLEDYLTSLN